MKRVTASTLLWLASFGAASFGTAALRTPALAQVGVYDEAGSRTLDEAAQRGRGVRISGHARDLLIPETYTVRRGDTLWDVTGRFYGNPWEWPRVWSYNPEITNPHWIYPLDVLRLLSADSSAPSASETPDGAPRVTRARRREPEGSVFLRQQGYLDREALEQAGVIAGSPEDHMMLAPYDSVYVEFEEGARVEAGAEYTVFREIPSAQRQEGEEGTLVRIFGTVRVDSYNAETRTARATIIEALDPIERGFRVAPMPRQFDLVPPRPADRDLVTTVAATLRPRELLGDQQIVFLPVGREDGVALGNRFFVVRQGDVWREELPGDPATAGASTDAPAPGEYPTEVIAEGRVVHVRPHSATLMITSAVREARIGDRVEMREGY